MNCEQMTALLSAFLDGELTEQEQLQVQAHLEQCAQCRALYEQLQTLQTSFSDLEEIPAPENFAQGVMSRIKAETKLKVVPLFKRPQFRAVMGLAACAVLCIGFGRVALDGGYKNESAQMAATAAAPESGAAYDAMEYSVQATAGGSLEPRVDDSPAELAMPEAAAPEMPASPSAAEPAMPEPTENLKEILQMDGAAEKLCAVGEIVLEKLPEGFEETVGPLAWEERSEDGALCVQLTAAQAQTLLELAAAQSIPVEQTASAEGESWTLVLKP